ncbi:hypothetical protein [Halodesulfovibrio sp.]|uniref:hypothetical protein n=1 Tax=Halodesulfovibrio sp. TaxID=1912772 RepID=UPI0025E8C93A|nr:hypothetical protein [Halodesulfovibrio sp.]MCT4626727.1 hypothetical protein [Halodesulfovibrio sp.]
MSPCGGTGGSARLFAEGSPKGKAYTRDGGDGSAHLFTEGSPKGTSSYSPN